MIKVTTKITNKKTTSINLNLPNKYSMSTSNRSIEPGKSLELDFDIWSKLSNTNKLRLERLVKTNQITIETKVYTADNKLVTVAASSVNIEEVPKEELKKNSDKPAKTDKQVNSKVDPTFRTSEDRNAIKGYKVVDGSDSILKLGFKTEDKAQTFDHSKALANNNDTKGFAEVSAAGVTSLVNKNPKNVIKVDAPGLFKTATEEPTMEEAAMEEAAMEESSLEETATMEESVTTEELTMEEPKAPTVIINEMLAEGRLDDLKEYLTELYPDLKFTKKALKDCTTAEDIKLKFGLDDLL